MTLLPANNSESLDEYLERISNDETTQQPSLTYAINFDKSGAIHGMIDEQDAVIQFIRKAIITERGKWRIYTDDYGCELPGLIGQDVTDGYIQSEIPRMVSEAIDYDERILSVDNVTATRSGDAVIIICDVATIYGDIVVEAVV